MGRKQQRKANKQKRLEEKRNEKQKIEEKREEVRKEQEKQAEQRKAAKAEAEKTDKKQAQEKMIPKRKAVKIVMLVATAFAMVCIVLLYWQKVTNDKLKEAERMISTLNQQMITVRESESTLNQTVADLEGTITVLSESLASKSELVEDYEEQERQRYMPTAYPLKGSAAIQEVNEEPQENEIPSAQFVTVQGTKVVTTAFGQVSSVTEDEEYGMCITVDHGNGYITTYLGNGTPVVDAGDFVATGTVLMTIAADNSVFVYQIWLNGEALNPAECMEISG